MMLTQFPRWQWWSQVSGIDPTDDLQHAWPRQLDRHDIIGTKVFVSFITGTSLVEYLRNYDDREGNVVEKVRA